MQTGGRNKSQQARVVSRGTAKATTRNAEEKRKKAGESGKWNREVKAGSVADSSNRGTDAEAKRKPHLPAVNGSKPKVITYSKADENRVSYSIQKLLSVYQSAKADKSPDGPRAPNADSRKPKVYAKSSRGNVSKIPEIQGGLRNGPSNPDRSYRGRISPVQVKHSDAKDFVVQNRKSEEIQTRRALREPKLSPGVNKTELPAESEDVKTPGKGTEPPVPETRPVRSQTCDEIIPLLTPDRTMHTPLTQIHSFIANYLEEDSENRCDSKNKLEFFVPENPGSAFPVCSKRATDHIPSSDLVRPEMSPSTREFIIMLRRRNSEPYSQKNCILQYPRREEDHPLSSAGSDVWGFGYENYYFWEQGPIHPSKPYWEVSLFKSNKSSSALDSGAGMLSPLTPPKDSGEILINGDFGLRNRQGAAVPVRSWTPDLRSCKAHVRAVPFASSMEAVTARLPREPARVETPTEPGTRSRDISRDDQNKHPAHLLVYVKSSQKKLVGLDSRGSRTGNVANRKVHKIKKIVGGGSEATVTYPSKNIIFAVLSAVLLLTGCLAFFVYFLARRPALFSLTPPVPGLLRRC